jgi:hypothetical protein
MIHDPQEQFLHTLLTSKMSIFQSAKSTTHTPSYLIVAIPPKLASIEKTLGLILPIDLMDPMTHEKSIFFLHEF